MIYNYINRIARALNTCLYRKRRINYIGYAEADNLGDFYVYCAIKKLFNDFSFIYYSDYIGKEKILYDIYQKLNRRKIFEFNLIGGGTLIGRSHFLSTVNESLRFAKKNIAFGTGVMEPEFWKSMGQGYREQDLKRWSAYLQSFDYIGIRGPLSKDILGKYGVRNTEIIGDAALSLIAEYEASPRCKKNLTNKKNIGINIGYANNFQWGSDQEKLIGEVAKLARILDSENWNISFFCVWPYDLDSINRVKRALNKDIYVFNNCNKLKSIFNYFDSIDIFIGEKLHSAVFAAITYTPFIMLEYRPKCRDFMLSMDMEEFSVRTDSFDINKIMGKISLLYENSEYYRNLIRNKVNEYRIKQEQTAQKISAITD